MERGCETVSIDPKLPTLSILWSNLNSPGVLWKTLERAKDCVIAWIVKYWRATHMQRGWMRWGCENVLIHLNATYVLEKFELAKCCVEKVEYGQRLCNIVRVQILESSTHARGGWSGRLGFVLIDLDPIYVLAKPELSTYANWLVIIIVDSMWISIVKVRVVRLMPFKYCFKAPSQLYGSTTVVMAIHGLHWKWRSLTPCQRHPGEPIEKIFGTIDYVIDLKNLAKFGFGKIFRDWGTYTHI